jgi:succinate dehydrogenase/fumarate reductase cytochrome b subunit
MTAQPKGREFVTFDEPVDGHTMNFQVGRQLSCVHDFAGASGHSTITPSHFAPIRRASRSITVHIQALSPSAASPAAWTRIRFSSGVPRTWIAIFLLFASLVFGLVIGQRIHCIDFRNTAMN